MFKPTQALAAVYKLTGTIAQTLFKPTQAVTGTSGNVGTVAQKLFKPTQAVAACTPLVHLDGSPVDGGDDTNTVAITTTGTNELIVLSIAVPGGSVTSIASSNSLTYTKRYADLLSGLEIWSAQCPTAVTETATLTASGALRSDMIAYAFGVDGTIYPSWDTNVSMPAEASSGAGGATSLAGISTNTPDGYLFAISAGHQVGNTAGGDVGLSAKWVHTKDYNNLQLSQSAWQTTGIQAYCADLSSATVAIIPSLPTSGAANAIVLAGAIVAVTAPTATVAQKLFKTTQAIAGTYVDVPRAVVAQTLFKVAQAIAGISTPGPYAAQTLFKVAQLVAGYVPGAAGNTTSNSYWTLSQ